jgi:hypothetical protein
MVKHSAQPMAKFFTRERFGRPQFLAGGLLLLFLAQAILLDYAGLHEAEAHGLNGLGPSELVNLTAGWRQLHGGGIAGAPYPDAPGMLPSEIPIDVANYDTEHSPLLPIITTAPLLLVPQHATESSSSTWWRWLLRFPFLAVGVFLGASLWYVARRLCGNHGGFLALTLYCFSPAMLQAAAVWHTDPDILGAWGFFGAIFTAIAVAHTLYAPREVVLWNWRRIVLLGVSLAIAIGAQFSMVVVIPVALAFMLYLAPIRRAAATGIWFSACVVAAILLLATYFFHLFTFLAALRHASFWEVAWRNFAVVAVYRHVGAQIIRSCPALIFLLPVTIATYAAWRRTRYFGNTAPLLAGILLLTLSLAHPRSTADGFLLAAIPFLFIFVSGVLADLMETRYRQLVAACVWALVGAYIIRSVSALARIAFA